MAKIQKVRFEWSDNPAGTKLPDRRLWVERADGDRALVTFAALDAEVGPAERKRLVSVAIRRATSHWHLANAKASLAAALAVAA